MSLHDEVAEVIVKICRPDKPDLSDENKSLLDSGLDSLDFATLMLALEDKYNVTIGEDDIAQVRTLKQIVSYLEGRVADHGMVGGDGQRA